MVALRVDKERYVRIWQSLGIAMAAYGAMSDASIYSHHGKRREYSRFIWVFNGEKSQPGLLCPAVFDL